MQAERAMISYITIDEIPFTTTHIVFITQVCKIEVCNFNS